MEYSLESLIHTYETWRPSEIPTIRSILKNIVIPHVRTHAPNASPELIPAASLYGLLDRDNNAWKEEIAERLPPGETYQKAYLRVIKRLIRFGEKQGSLHPDQYEISPRWRDLVELLSPLVQELPNRKRSRLRTSFKKLARWATKHGLSPENLPLQGHGERTMAEFWSIFPTGEDADFYAARKAWNLLVVEHPEFGLHDWVHEGVTRCRGVARENWPECIQDGIDALFCREGLGGWSEETRLGYTSRVANYLGALQDSGLQLDCFGSINDGIDALRLLFQGGAAEFVRGDVLVYAHRLTRDSVFRQMVLSHLRGIEGSFDGKASDPNPFLIAGITRMIEEQKIASAQSLLAKALAINRGILGVTDRHTLWLSQRIRLVHKLSKKNPNAYTLKKRSVFRNPHLWVDFVKSRSRLREHTLLWERRMKEATPAESIQQSWAVALRNEVLFGLMLCYPLRVTNLSAMQLGSHYDPSAHRIYFPAEEVKNGKEIDYELPDGGSLGDLRALVEQYLSIARPILLAGRSSPFFFVPNYRGGIRIPSKGFNLILVGLTQRFLADLLPEGVDVLNPHLFRHVAATYHLVVGGNLNLAAQILNDAPSTISQNYADILGYKKEATKRFLSGVIV